MSHKNYRFRLLISYNGFKYYGWQKQKTLPTIQGQIEEALKRIFQREISIIGAGRTDTGAHALGQTAHFDLLKPLAPHLKLKKALNSFLIPKNICIRQVWKVPDNFHALRSATEKYYIYFILNRQWPCVFRKNQTYWLTRPVGALELAQLQAMSQRIQGRHDFKSFQSAGTPVKSTIRTITSVHWKPVKKHILAFHIKGEGFLKQMIRNLVGTQLKLLKYKDPVKKLDEIFSAKDRKAAYEKAPADGLYLYKISYPSNLDRKCQPV